MDLSNYARYEYLVVLFVATFAAIVFVCLLVCLFGKLF